MRAFFMIGLLLATMMVFTVKATMMVGKVPNLELVENFVDGSVNVTYGSVNVEFSDPSSGYEIIYEFEYLLVGVYNDVPIYFEYDFTHLLETSDVTFVTDDDAFGKPNTFYEVRVRAVAQMDGQQSFFGPWSDEKFFSTTAPPAEVPNLKLEETFSSIKVTYGAVSDPPGGFNIIYEFEYREEAELDAVHDHDWLHGYSTSELEFDFNFPLYDKKYEVRVRAVTQIPWWAGQKPAGPWSDETYQHGQDFEKFHPTNPTINAELARVSPDDNNDPFLTVVMIIATVCVVGLIAVAVVMAVTKTRSKDTGVAHPNLENGAICM